jgi:hypothetical protein
MYLPRPIQWYHFQASLIWRDGPFIYDDVCFKNDRISFLMTIITVYFASKSLFLFHDHWRNSPSGGYYPFNIYKSIITSAKSAHFKLSKVRRMQLVHYEGNIERGRITATSSFKWNTHGIAGNTVGWCWGGKGVTPPVPTPLYTAGFWTDFWRRRNRFLLYLGYLLYVVDTGCRRRQIQKVKIWF